MKDRHAEQRLENVRSQIESWRRTRGKRCTMPENLWNEAVALAEDVEPYRVSRVLRLNYDSLRRHIVEKTVKPAGGDGFVELSGTQVFAQLTGGSPNHGSTIQVVSRDGARLTIQSAPGQMDIAELVNAFLRREA